MGWVLRNLEAQGPVPVTDNDASLTVDGTVNVGNLPATQPVSIAAPVPVTDNGGSLTVDGTVGVTTAFAESTASASATGIVIGPVDASAYQSFSLQLVGGSSNNFYVEGSNNNTDWSTLWTIYAGTSNVGSLNKVGNLNAGNGPHVGWIFHRYIRVRCSSYIGPATALTLELFARPFPTPVASADSAGFQISVAQAINSDTMSPSASQGSIPAYGLIFNGSTWERRRSFGVTGAAGVSNIAGTSGGWSVSSQTALTNTKVAVKTSAGQLGGYMIYNSHATAVAYVQVFDLASGSVTLGTTAPTYVLSIPPASAANLELTCGVAHATAITVAATATATGSGAPSSTLVAAIFYK